MAIQAERITVGTTPTYLGTLNADDMSLLVKNVGTTDLVLGGADVTAATGYPFAAGTELAMDVYKKPGDKLYAVAASGSSTVAVFRVGA